MSKTGYRIYLKLILCIVLLVIVSIPISNTYAQINKEYYEENLGAFKVSDTKDKLDKKAKSSVLLDALGSMVYAVASFGEWIIGVVFQAASGGDSANNIFPWADAIVFNAIPLLDINFLNPYSAGTLVGGIKTVIQDVYGTLFGLAIAFFSIAVLVMGIKIAISTIASEKAKYKQAVWEWFLALILLFTIHFFISFVFYLNEQLVAEASNIAKKSLNSGDAQKILNLSTNSHTKEEIVSAFVASQYIETLGDSYKNQLTAIFVTPVGIVNQLKDMITKLDQNTMKNQYNKLLAAENVGIAADLLQSEDYMNNALGGWWANDNSKAWWNFGTADPKRVDALIDSVELIKSWKAKSISDVETLVNTQKQEIDNGGADILSMIDAALVPEWAKLKTLGIVNGHGVGENTCTGLVGGTWWPNKSRCKATCDALFEEYKSISGGSSKSSLISNLAQYFKKAAWSTSDNSWKASKVVIQNAVMYAILVVQSFMFLIAYIKRLFYVIMLAMMAPLVVVYDFFNKSLK